MKQAAVYSMVMVGLVTGTSTFGQTNPFPQMIPDQYMEPGFHVSVDEDQFPAEMRNAISDYRTLLENNEATANALFEQKVYVSQYADAAERYDGEDRLTYEIMEPPADAVAPPEGFPLVFTTYGRETLADVMALSEMRENYPAYVVAFIHSKRPGPLHPPPVYSDYALLFHEAFDYFFETYNIDENRVYGSGWSRGGSSMAILSHAKPERRLITAAVPSAGGFQNMLGPIEDIAHIKWFSLQGANDGNSNPKGSQHAFDQLEKAGALDNIFWWVEGAGHSPHKLGWQVAETIEWLFAQSKADLALRPDAVLTVDVEDAAVPFSFTADATGSTANNGGSIQGYTWQIFQSRESIADYSNRYLHGWELDTGFEGAAVIGTGPTVSHTLEEPGTYWLRVIVEDDEGNRRAATHEIFARRAEPEASFVMSRNHEQAGEPITFDASESLAEYGSTIASYAWDFGDGHSGSGEQVTHPYAAAGEYTVTLTVTTASGKEAIESRVVTVNEIFPGYRYFRFVGLDMLETYRNPYIREFTFKVGSKDFPEKALSSNNSEGIVLEASWETGENLAYRAFDKDESTFWQGHNYFTPGVLDIDVGEEQRFVPTGVHVVMADSRYRWIQFHLEGSVDNQNWDTLWTYDISEDGSLADEGEEILFEGVKSIEVVNVEDGGVYPLGTQLALQASLSNLENVTGVSYYANGELIGTAATAPYEVVYEPEALGDYEVMAQATYAGGAQQVETYFPLRVTIEPAPEPYAPVINQQPESADLFEGDSMTLTAEAEAYPAITGYQWFRDGTPLVNDSRISGADSSTLTIDNLTAADHGDYILEVTNEAGTTATEAATVTVLEAPDWAIMIDFGTNFDAPEGSWNSLDNGATHENLIDSTRDAATPVALDMVTTAGSGIQTSGNTTAWGSREIAPVWADTNALSDRLWVDAGDAATLRFRNLEAGKSYILEIASGFAGGGDAGSQPGIFEVMGATGPVEGYNAHTEESLGTEVYWTSRGPNDGGEPEHSAEGWLLWEEVAADENGEIEILLSTDSGSLARVSLNALRLMEAPETAAPAPAIEQQPQGLSINVNDTASFTVVASSEEPMSYQWQKDGEDIAGATEASFSIEPAGVSDSGIYRVAVSNANGTTLSAEAVLEVNGLEPTVSEWPEASELEYGQSLAESTLTGGAADIAGTFAFADPSAVPDVGTMDQAVVFRPEDGFSYEPVSGTISVTVNPVEATVTLSDLSVTYDGSGQSPTVVTDPAGLDVAILYDGGEVAPTEAGSYAVEVTVSDANASGSATGNLVIEPAPLTVRAEDTGKFEGEADPALSWTITSGELFGSDSLSGSLSRESGESVGTYAINRGSLTASPNYDLSFASGTFTILEAGEAPWEMQADFDGLELGNLAGQGGWTGENSSTAAVVVDPADAGNHAFQFGPNNNDEVGKVFSTAIQTGEVATLFYRLYVPAGGGRINQQLRLLDSSLNYPVRIKKDNDPSEPLLWLFGAGMDGASKQQVEQTISRDTWYNLWVVLDNANGLYRMYIEGGEHGTQTLVTSPNMVDATGAHPFHPAGIESFRFIGWDNVPVIYDDIYLAHGGENLSNPVAPVAPEPSFGTWIEQYAGLTEAEQDPDADPAGDGVSNLLKYAFGLEPTEPAHGFGVSATEGGLPVVVRTAESSSGIALRYRRDGSLGDIRYTVEWSSTLAAGDWSTDHLSETVVASEGDVEVVEVRFTQTPAPQQQFLRVKVEQ